MEEQSTTPTAVNLHKPLLVATDQNGYVRINCPGCGHHHAINLIKEEGRPCWHFNGDLYLPTFSPSLLVTCGHYVQGQPQPPNCYHCNRAKIEGFDSLCSRCHSFIREGKIQFLSDSTHALSGQTVNLLPIKQYPVGR